MKQNKLFLGLATLFAAAFTFTACSSDDAESQSVQQDRTIRLTSSEERGSTRATSDPQSDTSLSTNSSLGVIAINSSSATLTNGDNEPYSVDGSGNLNPTTTANKMTWPASGNVSFYAYAPRINGATYNGTNAFSVKTDQTTEANYLASDLVLAKNENVAKTESAVELSFNHLMAKINITIQKATNATVDLTNAKVSIINTQPTCTFKPNATGTVEDKVLGAASGDVTEITLVSALGTATTACGIIVPQTLAANTGLVKIQTAPGTANNRILIAKLSEEKTFASGQQYSFTVTINDPTAPITYITLKSGSPNLVKWENNALGASTKEFSLGDYICKDGSLLKASAVTNENKANIIAVIFSNQVSSTDAAAKYDGYAMGVATLSGKDWGGSTSWPGPNIDKWSTTENNAFNDLDGRTKNANILSYSTYTSLDATAQGKVLANLSDYTLAIEDGAIVGSVADGKKNLSGWFTPSIGQMIQILNNLGNAGLTASTGYDESKGSSPGWGWTGNGDSDYNGTGVPSKDDMIAVQTKINGYVTRAGKSAFGYNLYATVSEAGGNFWQVSFTNDKGYNLGHNPGKDCSSPRNVIPCLAFKLQ